VATPARRFPLPWSVEEQEECFVVKDGAGQKLAYVYYEEEPGRRSAAKFTVRPSKQPAPISFIDRAGDPLGIITGAR